MRQKSILIGTLLLASAGATACGKKKASHPAAAAPAPTPPPASDPQVPTPTPPTPVVPDLVDAESATNVTDSLVTLATPDTIAIVGIAGGAALLDQGMDAAEPAQLNLAATDYDSDVGRLSVRVPGLEALEEPQQFLCIVGQLNAHQFADGSPHTAVIDWDRCQSSNDAQSSDADSGDKPKSIATATFTAQQAPKGPLITSIWIDVPAVNPDTQANLRMRIKVISAAAKSTDNPLGIHTIYYKGVGLNMSAVPPAVDTTATAAQVNGFIKMLGDGSGGAKVLAGHRTAGLFGKLTKVGDKLLNADIAADGSGTAAVRDNVKITGGDAGPLQKAGFFKIAFNSSNILRKDGSTTKLNDGSVLLKPDSCLDRAAAPMIVASRVGLYDATTKMRLEPPNTGFLVNYQVGVDAKSKPVFGTCQVSQSGLGCGPVVMSQIQDGATVKKTSFDADTGHAYTFKMAPGKLFMETKSELALSAIKDLPLQTIVAPATAADKAQVVRIAYNGTGWVLLQTLTMDGTGALAWTDSPANTAFTFKKSSAFFFSTPIYPRGVMIIDGAGNPVAADGNTNPVIVYSEQDVTLMASVTIGAATVALDQMKFDCFDKCVVGKLAAAGVPGGMYQPAGTIAAPNQYVWNAATQTLVDGSGNPVSFPAGTAYRGTVATNMVRDADKAGLSGKTHQVTSQPVWFSYRVGPSWYNKEAYLLDQASANAVVKVNPPATYSLAVSAVNDFVINTKYIGQTYAAKYYAFGDLRLPYEVNANQRWEPAFTPKSGTMDAGGKALVKILRGAVDLPAAAATACSALSVDKIGDVPSFEKHVKAPDFDDVVPATADPAPVSAFGTAKS